MIKKNPTWLFNMSTQNVTDVALLECSVCLRHSVPIDASSPPSLSLLRTQQLSAAGVGGSLAASRGVERKAQTKPSRKKKNRRGSQLSRFSPKPFTLVTVGWESIGHQHTVCNYTRKYNIPVLHFI